MAKINTTAFEEVSQGANLSHDALNDEVVKQTIVYNIPKNWVDGIKKNKMTVSGYLKQALYEKLMRDKIL